MTLSYEPGGLFHRECRISTYGGRSGSQCAVFQVYGIHAGTERFSCGIGKGSAENGTPCANAFPFLDDQVALSAANQSFKR